MKYHKKLTYIGLILLNVIFYSCTEPIEGDAMSTKDFDADLINRTFYMNNHEADTQGKNYSYKNISFFDKKGKVYYAEAFYYPTDRIRTVSYFGVVQEYKNHKAVLFPTKKTEIINEHKQHGIYAPFKSIGYIDIDESSKRNYTYYIEKIGTGNTATIIVQGDSYKDYKADLLASINNKDYVTFLRLYHFYILNHQSKMKDFGLLTTNKSKQSGFVSGSFDPELKGVEGIDTVFDKYSDFPDTYISGNLFGKTDSMEKTVRLYIDDKHRASVTYDNVKVDRGVAAGGTYGVALDGVSKDVTYSVLPE